MRYKISYGPDDKRDRWGRTIKAATIYSEYAETTTEAEKRAVQISKEYPKWDVHIYDTKGPQIDPDDCKSTLWLIVSYKRGVRIFTNIYYR